MQEFLSAFYVSQLPDSELFEQFSYEEIFPHMNVVWRFVAGLTGFGAIGCELIQSSRGNDRHGQVTPFVVQCLYEAQEKADCESVFGRSKVVYSASTSTSVFDCFAVGYCIAVSRCTWEVIFQGSLLGPELVEMFVYGLRSQENVRGSIIDRLDLGFNPIGREGMAHLTKLPRKLLQQLSRLDLSACELDGTALDLLSDITPTMTSLKHLEIGHNPAGDGGTVKLLQSLATTNRLHTLGMEDVLIGCDCMTYLSDLIRPSGNLKKLDIGDKRMQHDCVELLLKTVLSPSSLKHLVLYVGLTTSSFEHLKENRNITVLALRHVTMGTKTISRISQLLHRNTTLENLRFILSSDSIPGIKDELRALSCALKVNRSLKTLGLFCVTSLFAHLVHEVITGSPHHILPREEVRALVGALQYNQTLEKLQLPDHCQDCYYFSQEEFTALGNRVGFVREVFE